jgi:hypothetical protein
MGVIILSIVTMLIALAFARGAVIFMRQYKWLYCPKNISYCESHPVLYGYLRHLLPIVIAGFLFNSMFAFMSVVYFILKYFNLWPIYTWY